MATVTASADSYVNEASPSSNYVEAGNINVQAGTPNQRFTFLRFPRPFPLGATILSAVLKVRTAEAWSGSVQLTVRRMVEDFQRTELNWNNKPSTVQGTSASVTVVDAAADQQVEIDVTTLVQELANGATSKCWRITTSSTTLRKMMSTNRIAVLNKPTLEITWADAPYAPTNLKPSGARAVKVSKPVLSWVFSDPSVAGRQTASQVQIDDNSDFSSPIYDSGKTANVDNQWDLSTTAYAGITAGTTRYWRVRVWDDADLPSPWSSGAEFTRTAAAALAITNPAASPNNFVEETTPVITWTFTGQVSYELTLLEQINGRWKELWKQPQIVSTSLSKELPPGLLQLGHSYKIRLRTWDNNNREATSGQPTYEQAERAFIYQKAAAGPAAVTTLAGNEEIFRLWLTWSYTPAPDFFSLKIDGDMYQDRIVPADVHISGSNYGMWVNDLTPRVDHTVEMEAVKVLSGIRKHSSGNNIITVNLNPATNFLINPDTDEYVALAGGYPPEPPDLRISKVAASYAPVGRRDPVVVVDVVRGWEGTFSAVLLSLTDRDKLLGWWGQSIELRLLWGDLNIPIRIEDLTVAPSPGDKDFAIGVTFFQTGEFTVEDGTAE